MVVVHYRKPKYHKDKYPWTDNLETAQDALDFADSLGPEYECKFFAEITMKKLAKLADDGK